jgi:hypothetical protein
VVSYGVVDGLGEVVLGLGLPRGGSGLRVLFGYSPSAGLLRLFFFAFLAETAFCLLAVEGEETLVFGDFVLEEHA